MFRQRSRLPGTLEQVTSRGCTSSEFIRGNFSNKQLLDVVYVSANGWYANLKDEISAEVHEFEFVEREAADGLTSRPETVGHSIREFAENYPKKRLIGHFMQPHQPYLGPTGKKFAYRGDLKRTLAHSDATHEDVIQAYHENLDLVLAEVASLLEDLDGKTVVTADHGEVFGQRGWPIPVMLYGHPKRQYLPELVTVPWHTYEDGTRREIVAEHPERDDVDIDAVKAHLADLGYADV